MWPFNPEVTRQRKVWREGSQKRFPFRNFFHDFYDWNWQNSFKYGNASQGTVNMCSSDSHVLAWRSLRVRHRRALFRREKLWWKADVLASEGGNLTWFLHLQRPPRDLLWPIKWSNKWVFNFYTSSYRTPRTTQLQLGAFPSHPYGQRFLFFFLCLSQNWFPGIK